MCCAVCCVVFFPFHFDSLDLLAFFLASILLFSSIFSASGFFAPVLPFFFTSSFASLSASSHPSTGPCMASSRAVLGYLPLLILLLRRGRMLHQQPVCRQIAHACSVLIAPPSGNTMGSWEPTCDFLCAMFDMADLSTAKNSEPQWFEPK